MAARADRPMLFGLMLAMAIIAGWLAIHIGGIFFWRWHAATLPVAALLIAGQAWLSTGLFIIAHDSMHGSLAPGRPRLNRALGTLCLSLYAALSYRALLPKHHAHHRQPGSAEDPDFHMPTHSPAHPMLPWLLRFFTGYYTHAQIVRITLVALVYIFVFGASLLNIAMFWAVPALIALLQLFVFGTYLPHRHGHAPFADHHHARSSAIGPVLSFVTCFHFGGYHHEHHLHPGTPWWRLPATRARRDAAQHAAG
jgi:beta-carotene ketolase (CrtW type)